MINTQPWRFCLKDDLANNQACQKCQKENPENNKQTNLNIGSGPQKIPNYTNIDNQKHPNIHIQHDLNTYPYPFPDNHADNILASHIIEHLDNPDKALKELHRILKPNGTLTLILPHYTNPHAYQTYHKTYYSTQSIRHLIHGHNIQNNLHAKDRYYHQKEIRLNFYKGYHIYNHIIEPLANIAPQTFEYSILSKIFPIKEIQWTLQK